MNHAQFQQALVLADGGLAPRMGWSWMHVQRSRVRGMWLTACNVTGWLDLQLWSTRQPGRHLMVELKIPPDRLTPAQVKVSTQLENAGFEVYVWTPADLNDGTIAKILMPRPTAGVGLPVPEHHPTGGTPPP